MSGRIRRCNPWHLPLMALVVIATAGCQRSEHWHLDNVTHIVAPLKFDLQRAGDGDFTQRDLHGKIAMLYFGYTHCPDVCPTTLAKLAAVLKQLGPQAADMRVLFVSVDPQRDSSAALKQYVDAFDAEHFIGLRGSSAQITAIARRYRVGYTLGTADASGDYAVSHSSAVFIFDRDGDARLLGTETSPIADFVADLKQLE